MHSYNETICANHLQNIYPCSAAPQISRDHGKFVCGSSAFARPFNLATQVMDYHGSMSNAFERFAVRPSSGLAEPRDNFMVL